MKPGTTPEDEEAVIARLRERLAGTDLAKFKFERPSFFSFRTPVEVEVYGDRLPEVHAVAQELRDGSPACRAWSTSSRPPSSATRSCR
jgi:hypothetical protein